MHGSGARRSLSPRARILVGIGAVALLLAYLAPTSLAAAPNPAPGTAHVDGDPSEWTSADQFADLTSAGNPAASIRARLSLRYDCDSHTLFALVMATGDGRFLQTRPEEAYLRLDGSGKLVSGLSGNDGDPPDFSWVDGDGSLANGWEGSGVVAPGSHTLRAHVLLQWDDADGYLPLDTIGVTVPLVIECATATATPTATATATPIPTGSVEPTATATATPIPTPTVAPTAAPTATPTPAPTAAPHTTLPPTDTGVGGGTGTGGLSGLFVTLVFLGTAMVGSGVALSLRRRRDG